VFVAASKVLMWIEMPGQLTVRTVQGGQYRFWGQVEALQRQLDPDNRRGRNKRDEASHNFTLRPARRHINDRRKNADSPSTQLEDFSGACGAGVGGTGL
jgi:hypothetical protein